MRIEEDINLDAYTTFHVKAHARYFVNVKRLDELQESLDFGRNREMMILGGGSNLLMTRNFDGLVIRNEIGGIEVLGEDGDHIYVKAGAGENWHGFVRYCVDHNYAGVENLSLIPGNVGASPMQNIGAYGVEIRDVFHELEALHIQDRSIRSFRVQDCAFGYRESVFKGKYKGQYVITSVTFRLNKRPSFNTSYGAIKQELEKMGVREVTIQAISQAVINIRSSKLPDPVEIGNAGSFFKNPVIPLHQFEVLKKGFPDMIAFPAGQDQTKLAAGWLIEQCGWKGYRSGDAGCYPKQALVLVNYGNASGKEILDLSTRIIDSVQKKFGVVLEREVNIV
jgi:UDP-N-acetylmuramate dehydrogenase